MKFTRAEQDSRASVRGEPVKNDERRFRDRYCEEEYQEEEQREDQDLIYEDVIDGHTRSSDKHYEDDELYYEDAAHKEDAWYGEDASYGKEENARSDHEDVYYPEEEGARYDGDDLMLPDNVATEERQNDASFSTDNVVFESKVEEKDNDQPMLEETHNDRNFFPDNAVFESDDEEEEIVYYDVLLQNSGKKAEEEEPEIFNNKVPQKKDKNKKQKGRGTSVKGSKFWKKRKCEEDEVVSIHSKTIEIKLNALDQKDNRRQKITLKSPFSLLRKGKKDKAESRGNKSGPLNDVRYLENKKTSIPRYEVTEPQCEETPQLQCSVDEKVKRAISQAMAMSMEANSETTSILLTTKDMEAQEDEYDNSVSEPSEPAILVLHGEMVEKHSVVEKDKHSAYTRFLAARSMKKLGRKGVKSAKKTASSKAVRTSNESSNTADIKTNLGGNQIQRSAKNDSSTSIESPKSDASIELTTGDAEVQDGSDPNYKPAVLVHYGDTVEKHLVEKDEEHSEQSPTKAVAAAAMSSTIIATDAEKNTNLLPSLFCAGLPDCSEIFANLVFPNTNHSNECVHCKQPFGIWGDQQSTYFVASPLCKVQGEFHPKCLKERKQIMKEKEKPLKCISFIGRLKRKERNMRLQQKRQKQPTLLRSIGSGILRLARSRSRSPSPRRTKAVQPKLAKRSGSPSRRGRSLSPRRSQKLKSKSPSRSNRRRTSPRRSPSPQPRPEKNRSAMSPPAAASPKSRFSFGRTGNNNSSRHERRTVEANNTQSGHTRTQQKARSKSPSRSRRQSPPRSPSPQPRPEKNRSAMSPPAMASPKARFSFGRTRNNNSSRQERRTLEANTTHNGHTTRSSKKARSKSPSPRTRRQSPPPRRSPSPQARRRNARSRSPVASPKRRFSQQGHTAVNSCKKHSNKMRETPSPFKPVPKDSLPMELIHIATE